MKKCNDVFAEQLKQVIIEEAHEVCKVGECHYLPHHTVFREDKGTFLCERAKTFFFHSLHGSACDF